MRVAITDANIFIDLHYLELLDRLFVIGLEIHTTLEVINELDDDQIIYLKDKEANGELLIYILQPDEQDEITQLEISRGLSRTDKSVYYYSQKVDSIVLTGDKTLRKNLEAKSKEVHGVVWIFDQWVEKEVMAPEEAAILLQSLVEFNTWLPVEECLSRIDRWQN